jgi:hypothetical protein
MQRPTEKNDEWYRASNKLIRVMGRSWLTKAAAALSPSVLSTCGI